MRVVCVGVCVEVALLGVGVNVDVNVSGSRSCWP